MIEPLAFKGRAWVVLSLCLFTSTLVSCKNDSEMVTEPIGSPSPELITEPSADASPEAPESTPTNEASALATSRAADTLPRSSRSFGSAGTGDGEFQLPFCVTLDSAGTIYVGDSTGLQAFDNSGAFLLRFGAGELTGVQGVAVRQDGSRIYAAHQTGEVLIFGPGGESQGSVGPPPARAAESWAPVGLTLDADGRLYVGDSSAGTVEVFGPNGGHERTITGRSNEPFSSPRSLAFDAEGRLYVGLGDDFLVQRFTADGSYIDSLGHSYSDESMFRVGGLAVDDSLTVYLTRAVNQYIQVLDASSDPPAWRGDIGGPGVGSGALSTPTGIAVHDGELYVADQNNHRIQVFSLP